EQKLPDEPRRLAIVLSGKRHPDFWEDSDSSAWPSLDFFDLKGVIEGLIEDLHVSALEYRPAKLSSLHPGWAAELVVGEKVIGHFGELHPRVSEAFGLSQLAPTLVGEIDLEALRGVLPARHLYQPVPRFPAALRDVAVIVPESLAAEKVASEIRAAGG